MTKPINQVLKVAVVVNDVASVAPFSQRVYFLPLLFRRVLARCFELDEKHYPAVAYKHLV